MLTKMNWVPFVFLYIFLSTSCNGTSTTPSVTIEASSNSVVSGESVTLTWTSENASTCTASGAWSGPQSTAGHLAVQPTSASEYTLTCSDGTSSASQTVQVNVTYKIPTVAVSINPMTILSGQSATLTWSSTDATTCTAAGAWAGTQTTFGTVSISPTATSTYSLNCTGLGGSATQSKTVTVTAKPPPPPKPTLTFAASPTSIVGGQTSTLSWTATNTNSCVASGAWSGNESANGSLKVSPAHNSNYTLTCIGLDGSTIQKAVTVNVSIPAPPAITMTSSPSFYKYIASSVTTNPAATPGAVVIGQFTYAAQTSFTWNVTFSTPTQGTVVCRTDSTSVPCPPTPSGSGSYTWSVLPGAHTFSVVASDNFGNKTTSPVFSWTYVTPAQQLSAATATANSAAACTAVQPFYWEIGDGANGGQGTAPLAQGQAPIGETTVNRATTNDIASSSKWVFGAYAVERLAANETIGTTSQNFLHMSSGYSTFIDESCGSANGVNTVSDCENIFCVYDRSGHQIKNSPCGFDPQALQTAYPSAKVLPNSNFTASEVGLFHYSGGHFQRFSLAQASPTNDGYPTGYGFNMGNEVYNGSSIVSTKNPTILSDLLSVLPLVFSKFIYTIPQLAGGIATNAADYAVFLQSILNQQLQIYNYLGRDSVCTLGPKQGGACPTAVYTPIVKENMHYSYGHWVEDDYTIPFADGSFNSAGKFGFYPWIDANKKYYGLVARFVKSNSTGADPAIGNGYASELCGRQIRYSFFTGLATP